MKKKLAPITHENFPEVVIQLEQQGERINGRYFGRKLASWLTFLLTTAVLMVSLFVGFRAIRGLDSDLAEIAMGMPGFVMDIAAWAVGLMPVDWNIWMRIAVPVGVLVVAPLVFGLVCRLIPFPGKKTPVEGQTEMERAENAVAVAEKTDERMRYMDGVEDLLAATVYIPCLVLVCLPVYSAIAYSLISEGKDVLVEVTLGGVILLIILAVVASIAGCGLFIFSIFQNFLTNLFYRSAGCKGEVERLKEFVKLLEQEAKEAHAAAIAQAEAEALQLVIDSQFDAARKKLEQIGEETADQRCIRKLLEFLQGEPDTHARLSLNQYNFSQAESEALRSYAQTIQKQNRHVLTQMAAETYPRGLEMLNKYQYERAMANLKLAREVDYRDGVALYALAYLKEEIDCDDAYGWIDRALVHGLDKGMEDMELEQMCQSAHERIHRRLHEMRMRNQEAKEREKAASLAAGYALAQSWRSCKHKYGDRCCYSCSPDNFPPLCTYHNNPNDMILCDKREA